MTIIKLKHFLIVLLMALLFSIGSCRVVEKSPQIQKQQEQRPIILPNGEIQIIEPQLGYNLTLVFSVGYTNRSYSDNEIKNNPSSLSLISKTLTENNITNGVLLQYTATAGNAANQTILVPALRTLPFGTRINVGFVREPIGDIEAFPAGISTTLMPSIKIIQNSITEYEFYRPIQKPQLSCIEYNTNYLTAEERSEQVNFFSGTSFTNAPSLHLSYDKGDRYWKQFYANDSITIKGNENSYFTVKVLIKYVPFELLTSHEKELLTKGDSATHFFQAKQVIYDKNKKITIVTPENETFSFDNVEMAEYEGTEELIHKPSFNITESTKLIVDFGAFTKRTEHEICTLNITDNISPVTLILERYNHNFTFPSIP